MEVTTNNPTVLNETENCRTVDQLNDEFQFKL